MASKEPRRWRDHVDVLSPEARDYLRIASGWARRRPTSSLPLRLSIRSRVLTRLRDLRDWHDHEVAHSEADKLLLELIADTEVSDAYLSLTRWCG